MEKNKNLQPEQELSPEDRLDQLLAEFLAAPDMELPPVSTEQAPEYESAFFFEDSIEPVAEPVPSEPPVTPEADNSTLPSEQVLAAETAEDVDILPILDLDSPIFAKSPAPQPETPAPVEEALPEEEITPAPDDALAPAEELTIGESLAPSAETEEIGADEQALEAAGLTTVEPEDQASDPEAPEEPTASIPILISTHVPENPEMKEPNAMTDPLAEQQPDDVLPEEEEYIPPRKTRPRKQGSYGFFSIPHMAAVAIWLAIIVFIGVGLGNILWEYAADMLAFGRESSNRMISIEPGDLENVDALANKLCDNGLIKYPGLFKLYFNLTGSLEDIKLTSYTLNTAYDYMALKQALTSNSSRVTTKVVIPEGYTTQQIFALLETKGVSTVAELEEAAANADLGDYWFLEGVDRSAKNCLEGYLFPDTYQFYLNHDATEVLQKFLDNFNKRFNDTMKENLVTLNETLSELMRKNGMSEEYISQHQMTIREVVIVASMIEKEAANTAEGFTIASVIYNRLTNPNAYPYLQIDATLVYITGNHNPTELDKAFDSPYNTYMYAGLIPGPISNPSRASLDAALEPAYDDTHEDGTLKYYYFYAFDPVAGEHKFSETLAEHDAFLDSLNKNEEETP